jgi:hypothetical protein
MELKSLTQRSKCAGAESGCFRILCECLDFSSIRLGVPFIAPRQLGAVGGQQGRQFLPSVEVRYVISFQNWHFRPLLLWADWRTGHCSVHTGQSGAPADRWSSPRVARRLRGRPLRWRPLAHRTVRCTTGPVNYSRTPLSNPESGEFTQTSLAHRTLSGASPDSPVCQAELELCCTQPCFSLFLSSSLVTVSSTWITMLVHKTIHQV